MSKVSLLRFFATVMNELLAYQLKNCSQSQVTMSEESKCFQRLSCNSWLMKWSIERKIVKYSLLT